MRIWGRILLAIGLGIVSASTARAGIYNPGASDDEVALYPEFIRSRNGKDFRDVILTLQSISVPVPQVDNAIRRRYIFQEELLKKYPPTALKTVEDRLQASAVLIRRRKFDEAQQLLRPVAMQQSELDNIPLQSNFVTALHLSGNLQAAIDTLGPVVRKWKQTPWEDVSDQRRQFLQRIGWDQGLYENYSNCDAAYLRLLKLRLREQLAKKSDKGLQPADALFEDDSRPPRPIRFAGENGEYTAGRSPDKVPARALAIVQQLILWLPDDLRVYWLLGDVYNSQESDTGKENRAGIVAAHHIFGFLSKIEPVSDEAKEQLKRRVAALDIAVARFAREDESELTKQLKTTDDGIPVDWRTVGVSFGAGFLLALGVVWQVREIQRRRLARLAKQQSRFT
jgi:hypothetical protein